MRFSLFELLLIAPAWAIAFAGCSNSPFSRELVSYTHSDAVADIWYGRDALLTRYGANATIDDIDIQQLAIDLDGLNDPWGNSYKLVTRTEVACENSEFAIHLYSTGEDGTSSSEGDDPDDLNTWSNDNGSYYWHRIQRGKRMQHAVSATICSPFLFALLVGLTRGARHVVGGSQSEMCTDPIGDEP